MFLKSRSVFTVSRGAALAVTLVLAGCSGAKELANALKNNDGPAGSGGTGGGSTGTGTGNTGSSGGTTPVAVAIGAGVTKTAKSVEGGGLFVRVPDLGKITVADRSPQGGNGVTWTPNAGDTQITVATRGTLAGGAAIPGSLTLDKDEYFSGSARASYETYTPGLDGDGDVDFSKKYTVGVVDLYSAYADAQGDPVFLEYATYGSYFQGSNVQYGETDLVDVEGSVVGQVGGSGILGAIFGGTPTAKTDMPTGVTASYDGTFFGFGMQTSGKSSTIDANTSELVGDVALKANFSSGAVSGNVYNLIGESATCGDCAEALPLGLKLTGQIDPATGNTYQGSVAFTGAATTAASAASQATIGTVTSSDLAGQFYGPKAAETAGALRVEGTIPTLLDTQGNPYGPGMVIGSFGAKKAP